MAGLLIEADWLATQLDNPNIRIVDVRWYLPEPARGRVEYLAEHIAGAVFLNLETDLSGPHGSGPGRHPLPSAEAFSAAMAQVGISNSTHVIAYDSSGGSTSTRLWWLLRYYGHEQFSLLNGGWQAWKAAGLPTATGEAHVAPASFTAVPHPEMLVDAATVEELRHNPATLLLDARAAERYEGRVETIDSRAGHIPGAYSAPFAGNLDANGRLRSAEELHARFEVLGATKAAPLVCYCGSGVTATHNLLALELAGITGGLLYAGSWSDWSSDPERPVATGNEP